MISSSRLGVRSAFVSGLMQRLERRGWPLFSPSRLSFSGFYLFEPAPSDPSGSFAPTRLFIHIDRTSPLVKVSTGGALRVSAESAKNQLLYSNEYNERSITCKHNARDSWCGRTFRLCIAR